MRRKILQEISTERGVVVELRCARCDEWKAPVEFPVDTRRTTGRNAWCSECRRTYMRRYRDRKVVRRITLYFNPEMYGRVVAITEDIGVKIQTWMKNAVVAAVERAEQAGKAPVAGSSASSATGSGERGERERLVGFPVDEAALREILNDVRRAARRGEERGEEEDHGGHEGEA